MKKICLKCDVEFSDRATSKRTLCFECKTGRSLHKNCDNEKSCIKCFRVLPNTVDYFKKQERHLGNICHQCIKKYINERKINLKKEAIKTCGSATCFVCGFSDGVSSLCFHHLDPLVKDNKIGSMSIKSVEKEIGKCILVCHNCHREIHGGLHPSILTVSYSTNKESIYTRKWNMRQKMDIVTYMGGACVQCGYDKYLGALEFHHLNDDEKDFDISGTHRKLDSIKNELSKCIMLCSNCHSKTHHEI